MFELAERFKHKIKTAEEVRQIIGDRPRKNKVILCHGVFDVVHPGHIRHLLFAKSKAPILVVSLTTDKHINKGTYRPHVPETLRAINLAALEMVDYVVIDQHDTPLANILIIKPDIFAKGFEYSSEQKISAKTQEEIHQVQSYGGETIFTPGDFVLSSSKYIKEAPPNIKIEKLLMLMQRSAVSFADLKECLLQFAGKKVHVLGDTIIDSYTRCSMIGGQIKTPTMSVKFETNEDLVGGAGIVAAHLKAAGAIVNLTTVLGDDNLGKFAQEQFLAWGLNFDVIVDENRPTTNKKAIVVQDYRLLKIDNVDNSPINDLQLERICSSLSNSDADAFIMSDFRHGIFNSRTINLIKAAIPTGAFRVADSQVASRWGNILDFKEFDLITPNEREARFSLGDQDSGIRTLGSNLFRESKSKVLILKLGARGIITCVGEESLTLDNYFVMDSFVETIVDPVGAGDALLAYSTLAMITSKNPIVASILGNLAAACECEFDGNSPVSPEHVISKIDLIESCSN